MTIFFSGHTFKYELEGIAKLFFPLVRFKHIYTHIEAMDEAIYTRLKKGKAYTYLWVAVHLNGQKNRLSCKLSNTVGDYENECERLLCILLYRLLEQALAITPMWGILTGIRPVSIVTRLLNNGYTEQEVYDYLQERYLVSPAKIALCLETAAIQQPLLQRLSNNLYSLYVSIPFCPSRCSYCSFVSHAIDRKRATDKIDEYVKLLCVELTETALIANREGLTLDTIYIGGGTPTALTTEQLKSITDTITLHFPVNTVREYTIEAGRADSITREKLELIKACGAKRISINPQSFNDSVLEAIGRKHTAQQAEDCYNLAKDVGFACINMDFIAGLPTETLESFKATIDKAISLAPTNITVHTLSIKRSSELFSEGFSIKENHNSEMVEYSRKMLTENGYHPYYLYRQKNTIGNLENVGYAKDGYESLYNIYIMEEIQTILACGAGGVSKLIGYGDKRVSRIFNYKYHFEYIDGFDEILNRKYSVFTTERGMNK